MYGMRHIIEKISKAKNTVLFTTPKTILFVKDTFFALLSIANKFSHCGSPSPLQIAWT